MPPWNGLRKIREIVNAPPSRNDPCPCGSGRRYKHCHGRDAATASGNGSSSAVDDAMRQALECHRQHRLLEAARRYDAILAQHPALADALHMRGVVAYSLGDAAAAIRFIERACAAGLDVPDLHYNLRLAINLARDLEVQSFRLRALGLAMQRTHAAGDAFISPDDVCLIAFAQPSFHRAGASSLARAHGVGAFCLPWDDGDRALLDAALASDADFPFCLNVRGGDDTLIHALLPHFSSPGYVRVLGQPLLLVRDVESMPAPTDTFDRWRHAAMASGETPPYIVKTDPGVSAAPPEVGADAAVALPPQRFDGPLLRAALPPGLREDSAVRAFDARAIAAHVACEPEPDHTLFHAIAPRWDSTPRRPLDGTVLVHASPGLFRTSLRDAMMRARAQLPPGQRLVFVSAWNDRAEGASLEPDGPHDAAFLEAALDARSVPAGLERIAEAAARLMRDAGQTSA